MEKYDVIIVGAGISGLATAIHLQNEGLNVKVFEASDRVGGRIKSDYIDGYILDRGFQVLLTSYPEAQRMLDYNALNLHQFFPGAMVWYKDKLHRVADPFRKPLDLAGSIISPLSSFKDKIKITALRNRHKRLSMEDIFKQPETATADFLHEWNFSQRFQETFLIPFLKGSLLDWNLQTSSRMFEFVFKMFAKGYAALPAEGMQAIPNQLAAQLKENTISLNTRVAKINRKTIELESGEKVWGQAIVLALPPWDINKLLNIKYDNNIDSIGTTCIYFTDNHTPVKEPILIFNGNQSGYVNHLCVPSIVQPAYAPEGKHLFSVSIVQPYNMEEEKLLGIVKAELRDWFGYAVNSWEHLKTYQIPNALPHLKSIKPLDKNKIKAYKPGIYITGDHLYHASIQGSLEYARNLANALSWDLVLSKK